MASEKGLSTEMEIIKSYSNETKARYIVERTKEMTPEEKATWLTQMINNKVITADTMQEMKTVLQNKTELPFISR